LAICAAGAGPTLAAGTPASASRAPTATERSKIVSAIKDSEELRSIRARFDVHAVRITTVSTPSVRWAVAHIEPKPGFQLDGATVIVGRFYRAWKVIDLGTGGAGCWLPKRVVRDLRLGGCTADD
jgi:hypothetical protein